MGIKTAIFMWLCVAAAICLSLRLILGFSWLWAFSPLMIVAGAVFVLLCLVTVILFYIADPLDDFEHYE